MENAVNMFTDGLVTDHHPLSLEANSLSDALNATFVTYNGNEVIFQNDMGNTKILDSKTGNIVSLSPGFIPVGMKERGGVLYIASYNQSTKKGELGTIPSPMIKYTALSSLKIDGKLLVDLNLIVDKNTLFTTMVCSDYIILTNTKLSPGDKFLLLLNFPELHTQFIREEVLGKNTTYNLVTSNSTQGYFNLKLYAIHSEKYAPTDISDILPKVLQFITYNGLNHADLGNDYWFIDTNILGSEQLDFDQCLAKNYFVSYPNIPTGYLALKIEANIPNKLKLMENQSTNAESPKIYINEI